MTGSQEQLTHLRYIVYKDQQNQKQAVFWNEALNHPVYANKNGIKPQQMTSLGYIGFHKGQWIIYEHHQLDETGFLNERKEKRFIRTEFLNFPEINNKRLQSELEITYQREKNLFLFETKKMATKTFSQIKKALIKSRD